MPKYICKVLLEGSIDASYDGNTSILDEVLNYIESTKRFNTFQKLLTPQPIINVNSKKYEKPERRKTGPPIIFFLFYFFALFVRQCGCASMAKNY